MSPPDDRNGGLLARKGGARPSIPRDTLADATPQREAVVTLTLDPDRHARLGLASASTGRSSQQLLIEALDALFATMPDVAEPPRRQD